MIKIVNYNYRKKKLLISELGSKIKPGIYQIIQSVNLQINKI